MWFFTDEKRVTKCLSWLAQKELAPHAQSTMKKLLTAAFKKWGNWDSWELQRARIWSSGLGATAATIVMEEFGAVVLHQY